MEDNLTANVLQTILGVVTDSNKKLDVIENRLIETEIRTKRNEENIETLNSMVWKGDPSIGSTITILSGKIDTLSEKINSLEKEFEGEVEKANKRIDERNNKVWAIVLTVFTAGLTFFTTQLLERQTPPKHESEAVR